MVRYSVFVASFFLVIVPSYLEARAYYEDYDNDVGRPSSPDKSNKCRKDILLIVDTSRSIEKAPFRDDVKPFLKKFVMDDALNVGRDGTQIALMIFSDEEKMLIDFGKIFDAEKLSKRFDQLLQWDQVQGGLTKTNLALKRASEKVFPKKSPENIREDIGDVIILITDGEPQGTTDLRELIGTKKYAKELKRKNVTIVTIGVGPKRKSFKPLLEEIATTPSYAFDAAFDDMKTILSKLIAKSCIKAGKPCVCSVIQPSTSYVVSDNMKTKVFWKVPEVNCGDSGKKTTMKNSEYPKSSGEFGVGKRKITYSYIGDDKKKITCDVNINVEVCKCTDVGEVKAPLLKVGESKVKVSWKIPKPNCRTNDNKPKMDNAYLPYGKNIEEYHYEIGELKLTCRVEIVVDAVPCADKKFNPNEQECCNSEVYQQKNNHECCGCQYIDIRRKQCCPNFNERSIGSTCPGD